MSDVAPHNERRYATWGLVRDAVIIATEKPGEHVDVSRVETALNRKLPSPVDWQRLEGILLALHVEGEVSLFKGDGNWRIRYEGIIILNGRGGTRLTPVLTQDWVGDPLRARSWQNVATMHAPQNLTKWTLHTVNPW